MIKSLHIENFQSHENTDIVFSENFTAIKGLNNHGKSAVLRALKKVVRDEPSGDNFIRDNKDFLKIIVETYEGKVERSLKRDSSSDSNAYIINDIDKFVKFSKHGVPKEVQEVLGVSEIQSFGDSDFDINFHNQLDSLFLIVGQGLPSLRGRILSKITSIDKIQNAFSHMVLEEKRSSQSKKETQLEILSTTKKIDDLSIIDEQISLFEDFKSNYNKYLVNQETYQKVKSLITEVREIISKSRCILNKIKSLEFNLNDTVDSVKSKISLISDINYISILKDQIYKYNNIVRQYVPDTSSEISQMIKSIDLIKDLLHISQNISAYEYISSFDIPDVSHLQALNIQLNSVSRCIEELSIISTEKISNEHLLELSEVDIQKSEESLSLLRQELKICPVCNKPFEVV